MIKLLVFAALVVGRCMTGLGAFQTHLLSWAQDLGWAPPKGQIGFMLLQKRQASLLAKKAVKKQEKRLRKERRLERKLERQRVRAGRATGVPQE